MNPRGTAIDIKPKPPKGETYASNTACFSKRCFVYGSVRLWDLQTGKEIAALISLGNGESVTVTPDHYYRVSKSLVKGASFQVGDKLLPFEQFEQKLNKPDIVLERLSGVSSGIAQK